MSFFDELMNIKDKNRQFITDTLTSIVEKRIEIAKKTNNSTFADGVLLEIVIALHVAAVSMVICPPIPENDNPEAIERRKGLHTELKEELEKLTFTFMKKNGLSVSQINIQKTDDPEA